MFGRRKPKLIDVNQVFSSAVEAFLGVEQPSENGRPDKQESHRLATAGAVALGVALAAAGRAAYSRAKYVDLEQIADAVEERLAR